jgi:hypothetical protein
MIVLVGECQDKLIASSGQAVTHFAQPLQTEGLAIGKS